LNNRINMRNLFRNSPIKERRDQIVDDHGIEAENIFERYEDIFNVPLLSDAAIITTQDRMHVEPCILALEKGYHVLLEKPMALTEEDYRKMAQVCRQAGLTLNICHVLRYTHFFSKIKQIIDQGIIGDVYTVKRDRLIIVLKRWRDNSSPVPFTLLQRCPGFGFR